MSEFEDRGTLNGTTWNSNSRIGRIGIRIGNWELGIGDWDWDRDWATAKNYAGWRRIRGASSDCLVVRCRRHGLR